VAPAPLQNAQAAILTQAAAGAPAGSVKVTTAASSSAAPASASSAGSAVTAQATATDNTAQTAAPVTAVNAQTQNGAQNGRNDGGGNDAGANTPNPGGAAPSAPAAPAALASGVQIASASAQASSSQTNTDPASAPSGTPTPVALGFLGDLSPDQQVPITAQGAGFGSSVAVTPPGMDSKSLALDPVTGGSAVLTGDVASAATAAATQGIVQTEEPSAASPSSPTGFSQSLAAAANPAEQVKVQLTKGLKDGSDTINVLLHPEDLGTVEVKLQLQDGQVKATISADNPDTLALLKNDSHQLVQSLQDAGFNTDSNSLNFQMRGDQQSAGSAFAQQQDQGSGSQSSDSGSNASAYTSDSDIDEQVMAATAGTVSSDSGLDISV
jgi:flagellar hook-length control protein FliK